jgi:hypothetical protein
MRVLSLLLLAGVALAESRFPFTTSQAAEVIATLAMSSPGADWAKRGAEAAVAAVFVDGKLHQHVMLFAGPKRYEYRISLGSLLPGEHEIVIERDDRQSAAGAGLEAKDLRIEEIAANHADYDVYANAPVLFARLNTVGKFSDIPLLLYCERVQENNEPVLQYTVIFSNEDGGTSTRTLMARWGRSTDIEYVYKRFTKSGSATIQAKDHVETAFTGEHDHNHPLLMPVTNNNMIAAASKESPLQFRLAPVFVDLRKASREDVMDRFPITYEVMSKELEREGKLRPFGIAAGEKISAPRNYVFVDYHATLTNAAVTVLARSKDGNLYASDLGRGDIAIARDGYVRTTIELPPASGPADVVEFLFECRVPPPGRDDTVAHSGSCVVHGVSKVFFLQDDYRPGKSFLTSEKPVTIPTGRGISYFIAVN